MDITKDKNLIQHLKDKIQKKIDTNENNIKIYTNRAFYIKLLNIGINSVNALVLSKDLIDNETIRKYRHTMYPIMLMSSLMPHLSMLFDYESKATKLRESISKLKDLYSDITRSEIEGGIEKSLSEFLYREIQLL